MTTRGIIDIEALEREIVRQDDELREECAQAAHTQLPEAMMMAQLKALCCIHERLGNMLILDRSKGTN